MSSGAWILAGYLASIAVGLVLLWVAEIREVRRETREIEHDIAEAEERANAARAWRHVAAARRAP